MARNRNRTPKRQDRDEAVVIVCRGGECGSRRKHPNTDHTEQLRRIREGVPADVVVLVSKCLDACDHSNVIVGVPDARARSAGAGATWVGAVNDVDTTDDVIEWVQRGQSTGTDRPALVDIRTFTPTRRNRYELDNRAVR